MDEFIALIRTVIIVVVANFCLLTSAEAKQCSNIVNPSSSVSLEQMFADQWNDLKQHKVDKSINPQVKAIQSIRTHGVLDYINQDFYSITFHPTPSNPVVNPQKLFNEIRNSLPSLLFRDYPDSPKMWQLIKSGSLEDYDTVNSIIWESNAPYSALMTFNMVGLPFNLGESGSVVVSCHAPTSFIFTTAHTAKDNLHPVSGHRAFGMVANPDGSAMFFTKGLDRIAWGHSLAELSAGQVFSAGDLIWKALMIELKRKYPTYNPTIHDPIRRLSPYNEETEEPLTEKELKVIKDLLNPYQLKSGEEESFQSGIEMGLSPNKLTNRTLDPDVLKQSINTLRADIEDDVTELNSDISFLEGAYFASEYRRTFHTSLNRIIDPKVRQKYLRPRLENPYPALRTGSISSSSDIARAAIRRNLKRATDPVDRSASELISVLEKALPLSVNLSEFNKDFPSKIAKQVSDELKDKFKEQLENEAVSFISEELDISEDYAEQLLAIAKGVSDGASISEAALSNQRRIDSEYVLKLAANSGYCSCYGPNCSAFQLWCTGAYWIPKIASYDPNSEEFLEWTADKALEAYGYDEAKYLLEAKEYAEKLQTAEKIWRKLQRAKKAADSVTSIAAALTQLSKLDLLESFRRTDMAFQKAMLEPTSILPNGLPANFCEISSIDKIGDSDQCALMKSSKKLLSSLIAIREDLKVLKAATTDIPNAKEVVGFFDQFVSDGTVSIARKFDQETIRFYSTIEHKFQAKRLRTIKFETISLALDNFDDLRNDQKAAQKFVSDVNAAKNYALSVATQKLLSSRRNQNLTQPDNSIAESENLIAQGEQLTAFEIIELLSTLSSFYPEQSREVIDERLRESTNPFLFFRQFPTLFYHLANEQLESNSSLATLNVAVHEYRAWVVGDPHLQNFGSFMPLSPEEVKGLKKAIPIDNSNSALPSSIFTCKNHNPEIENSAILTMNDPDDGGEGSPVLDLVRYLTGLAMFDPASSANFEQLFDAYRSGLLNLDHEFGEDSNQLIQSAAMSVSNCSLNQKRSLPPVPGKEILKQRKDVRKAIPLTGAQEKEVLEILEEFVSPSAELLSSYFYTRYRGGSGGNWRIETLVSSGKVPDMSLKRIALQPRWYVVELKGMAPRPGNFPSSIVDYESEENRRVDVIMNRYRKTNFITHNWMTEDDYREVNPVSSYRMIKTSLGPAMLRYRLPGQGGYQLPNLSKNQPDLKGAREILLAIAKDQLHILGRIHAKTLHNSYENESIVNEFLTKLESNKGKIKNFAGLMSEQLESKYRVVKSNDQLRLARLRVVLDVHPNNQDAYCNPVKLSEEVPIDDPDWLKREFCYTLFTSEKRFRLPGLSVEKTEQPKLDSTTFILTEIGGWGEIPNPQQQAQGYTESDFHYVIIRNVSDKVASTKNHQFSSGFRYKLPAVSLEPETNLIVAANPDAFAERFDHDDKTRIVGGWENGTKLSNNGEKISLVRIENQKSIPVFEMQYSRNWRRNSDNALLSPELSSLFKRNQINDAFADQPDLLTLIPNETEDEQFTIGSPWISANRATKKNSILDLNLVMIMYAAAGANGKKFDFLLFENVASDSIDLSQFKISGAVEATLDGELKTGERVAVVKSAKHFKSRYGDIAQIYVKYDGNLSNKGEKIEIRCSNECANEILHKIKYAAEEWSGAVNGGGAGLLNLNQCSFSARASLRSWREATSDEIPSQLSCIKPALNLCGGLLLGKVEENQTSGGNKRVICEETAIGAIKRPLP